MADNQLYQTPKERFAADERSVKRHADLVARSDLRVALDVAMAQYAHQTLKATDSKPEAVAYKLKGAHEFMNTLLTLAAPMTQPTKFSDVNLPEENN
jgi:hypothetical protein